MTLAYRMLYVLLEGDDDERFFEEVVKPIYAEKYDHVQLWKYSQQKKERVNSFLNGVKSMQAAGMVDTLIVADLDNSPCVTDRKKRVLARFKALEGDIESKTGPRFATRVLIVCKEIESWYLAGLNKESCDQIGISASINSTDQITKEQFDSVMPSRFKTRISFLETILQTFDLETARTRNSSFRYFMQNFGLVTR